MDFIGAALQKLKATANDVGSLEVGVPWQVDKEHNSLPVAYYFLRGQGEIALSKQQGYHLEAGDLVFVPRGEAHCLSDGLPAQIRLSTSKTENEREPNAKTHFLYATIQAEISGDCPFISALPSLLILKAGNRAGNAYLEAHLQSLVWEATTSEFASELLQARLWEVVFLLAFRTYLAASTHHTTGWLAAIRDPQLARVLGAIQQHPHVEWTVERLAEEAAMSRATFNRHFVRVMGKPPMTFLYHHRMGIAASLLRQGESSLSVVAARVGYGSEAAFSNAFRRHFGTAPGAYRSAAASNK